MDSITSFFSKLFVSNAAWQVASTALDVGKTAVKKVWTKIVVKTAALDAGKKLINKGVMHVITLKSQAIPEKHTNIPTSPDAVAKKAHTNLNKHIDVGAQDISSLKDGSSTNAIAIQDLDRKLNEYGLKAILKKIIYIYIYGNNRSN